MRRPGGTRVLQAGAAGSGIPLARGMSRSDRGLDKIPLGKLYEKARREGGLLVAASDIISNLFLEDLERIWELKKWIPDPCNPHLHYLKPEPEEE